jgi:cell division protein FtsA
MRSWLALDIGATKVACAIGRPGGVLTAYRPASLGGTIQDASDVELIGSSLVAYPAIAQTWMDDVAMAGEMISRAIEEAGASAEITQAVVAIRPPSLVSQRVRSAIVLGDEPVAVRTRDLERVRAHALETVLGIDREPLMVERLGCDGNGFEGIRDPRGLPASRLIGTFQIVTMPMAVRRAVVQAVESAGLEVAQIVSTLPAVFASVASHHALPPRVLLIDIGGLTTEIALFRDGVCWDVRVVPWGGVRAATAMAAALRVTVDQAMQWTREGASCRQAEARAFIEQQWAVLTQAPDEALADEPRPDGVLLTGRGSLSDGCVEWIERATRAPTSLARPDARLPLGDLARQVGLSAAVGAVTLVAKPAITPSPTPLARLPAGQAGHAVDRLLHRAASVLTEYF